MSITTKELAQMCGVSRTTVHRALYGGGRIHPDTREMILRIAKEQDYRPDLLARGLVKGRTYYIGVVVMDVRNRYFSGMLDAISREAGRRGYNINITLHDNDGRMEREQLMRLASYRMDGIILSSVNAGAEYCDFLHSLGMPIVSVDNKIGEGIPFVSIDQRSAMAEASRRVLAKGYERLVFVSPAMEIGEMQNLYVHKERLCGFNEACRESSEVETQYLLDWNYLENAKNLLEDGKRTAFLCTADDFALEIMKHMKEKGKKAPADYGVVGFDNIDTLKYISPRLDTISNSVEEVAAAAVNLLFQLMNAQQEESCGEIPMEQMLPYRLIDGETI